MNLFVAMSLFLGTTLITALSQEFPNGSASQRVAALIKAYEKVTQEYERASEALENDPQAKKKGQELWTNYDSKQASLFMEAVELAKAEPGSQAAINALEFVLTKPRSYHLPAGASALELAHMHHARNPRIAHSIAILSYFLPHEGHECHRRAIELIRTVASENPDRTARGQALLGLAWIKKREYEAAEFNKNPEAKKLARETEHAFEQILMNYGDCRNLRTVGLRSAALLLGDEAKRELHELRFLQVGKVAPDIEGKDLDGKPSKLSDYRGKVVMLVFWASWCGPCMAEVPHEKKLVAQHKARPFAIVGVNGDAILADAKSAVKKHQMNWRSFWNGKEGPRGEISRSWNVRAWPTVYVIDEEGIIQLKGLYGKEVDQPLEALIRKAESKKL